MNFFLTFNSAFWELSLCLLEWYKLSLWQCGCLMIFWGKFWHFPVKFSSLFESFWYSCNFSFYSIFYDDEKNFRASWELSCIIRLSRLIYCILSEKKKPKHFLGEIICTVRSITITFNFILENILFLCQVLRVQDDIHIKGE